MNTSFVSLTTALPPVICGVGDYSLILAKGLRDRGLGGRFVVGGLRTEGIPERVEGFAVEVLRERTAESLLRALEQGGERTVLLQFSGYGYADRGLCFWLLEGLRRWKARDQRRRLVTMFHELYAFGPPWRTSFWTSWPQRRIAEQLAGVSDQAVCGRDEARAQLSRWAKREVLSVPVFSNVGELPDPPSLENREPIAVVFGQLPLRIRCWATVARARHLIHDLNIKKILDIGPGETANCELLPFESRALGALETEDISTVLRQARLAIIAYDDRRLASSGTFAAYCAHGCLTVNTIGRDLKYDDLSYGRELVRSGDRIDDYQSIASSAWRWYRKHDRDAAARLFAEKLAE